tara:strand:+ start:102 stop:593 length:492 start_codon:yes stop_codon:yes gene_type:complete
MESLTKQDKKFDWLCNHKFIKSVKGGADGKTLIQEEVDAWKHLEGYRYILLLYTSSWCPGCRHFNDILVDNYQVWNQYDAKAKTYGAKNIQVVFVSCDRDQDQYDELVKGMPWLAVQYGTDRSEFTAKIGVKTIPRPGLILGPAGEGNKQKQKLGEVLSKNLG